MWWVEKKHGEPSSTQLVVDGVPRFLDGIWWGASESVGQLHLKTMWNIGSQALSDLRVWCSAFADGKRTCTTRFTADVVITCWWLSMYLRRDSAEAAGNSLGHQLVNWVTQEIKDGSQLGSGPEAMASRRSTVGGCDVYIHVSDVLGRLRPAVGVPGTFNGSMGRRKMKEWARKPRASKARPTETPMKNCRILMALRAHPTCRTQQSPTNPTISECSAQRKPLPASSRAADTSWCCEVRQISASSWNTKRSCSQTRLSMLKTGTGPCALLPAWRLWCTMGRRSWMASGCLKHLRWVSCDGYGLLGKLKKEFDPNSNWGTFDSWWFSGDVRSTLQPTPKKWWQA